MNYTSLDLAKNAINAQGDDDDTLIARSVEAASRFIDRYCAYNNAVVNYFMLETVTDETLGYGNVAIRATDGHILCYPHKPVVSLVSATSYELTPGNRVSIDVNNVVADGGVVEAFVDLRPHRRARVIISYEGGLGATLDDLPADLIEATTLLSVRIYREARSSVSDAVGIAETGMIAYTKALPPRVVTMLAPLRRVARW